MYTQGSRLTVEHLCKRYRGVGRSSVSVLALDSLSFSIEPGEFFAVVGPSGCGKTTLLNVLGGFIAPDQGSVFMDGQPVRGPGPDRAVVFQDYGLFEWKTVLDNVAFGIHARGASRAAARLAARDYLSLVQLEGVEDRYPGELSGGMRQRIALARALAVDPKCILLDEPLAALDVHLRRKVQDDLLAIWTRTGKTMVLVTHDIDEAVYLADRVMVLTSAPARIDCIVQTRLTHPRSSAARDAARYALGDQLRERLAVAGQPSPPGGEANHALRDDRYNCVPPAL
jgi:NitT/TauT family transport system ATP-binding protein